MSILRARGSISKTACAIRCQDGVFAVLLGFWTACPLKIRSIRSTNKTLLQGVRNSGNASRFGTAAANIEAYTDTRWITVQSTPLPMSSDPSIGVDGRLLDVRHDGAVFTDRAFL